jgi:hypothetical protein
MARRPEHKKQLEAILGERLSEEALQRISLTQLVAATTSSDGSTTLRHLLLPRPNQCFTDRFLDVTGVSSTGADGKARLRLTHFLCPPFPIFGFPLNVVATPLSNNPRFLTLSRTIVDNGADVEIEVSTWDADGAPAASVAFDWRCRVELPTIIL